METTESTYSRIVDSIETVTRVDFSIYGNVSIAKNSALPDPNGLTKAEIHNNNEPVKDGAIDIRLGVIDKLECGTCSETSKCPGHFGHIRLAEPVFHMGFLQFVKPILSCICIRCHKLLVYKTEAEIARLLKNKQGKQRFNEIRALCKGVTHCQKENYGCGSPAHKIIIDKNYGNLHILAEAIQKNTDEETGEQKKRAPRRLTPQLCYDILRGISNEDCRILGFDPEKSRPEDMLIVNFPIPPVQVRPSIKIEIGSSSTMDDGLTHQIVEIIKNNENLKDAKGDGSLAKTASVNDDFMLLQLNIATYFANDTLKLPRSQQKNRKVIKSLTERLKGKEGRVRGNLMGKRVDMSARTVITSDPNISLNDVGIPLIIAKNLTYPEVVNHHNIAYLQQLVKNGRRVYPGANFVTKTVIDREGNEVKHLYHLKYVHKPIKLKFGDIVSRHLIDGDMVLFNRQPSLHKLSMMGHNAHIIPDPKYLTFRVNVLVTAPYGADFDGDEMNIHIPQSPQTVTELRLLANADKRFVKPANSRVAIVVNQDSLMGSYAITRDSTRVGWSDSMNILMATSVGINNDIPKYRKVSGKYLFSNIIPKDFNVVRKNDAGDYTLRIQNGALKDGTLTSGDFSYIVHKLWFQYGSKETKTFFDDLQRIILQYLMIRGFTVGIGDTIVSPETHASIYRIIETKRKEFVGAITEYENDPYIMTGEAFEISLQYSLRSVLGDVGTLIMNNFNKETGMYMCISAGSSGDPINAAQIIGCIGQVIVESKRIQNKFNGRTLPTFYKYDNGLFARGFCSNSFIKGLNPMEFFFQVMSGREGVISTAIKTARTGYIQRKLIKFLEDIKVEYDGTVRNANNKIIQCVYGDNGINTENQTEQKIDLIISNNQEVRDKFVYTDVEITKMVKDGTTSKYTPSINEKLYNKMITMRDTLRKIQLKINAKASIFKDSYMIPVDIGQQIINITSNEDRNDNSEIVDPYYVLKCNNAMYTGKYGKIMKYRDGASIIKVEDEQRIKLLLKFYLYSTLAPKKCTHVHQLTTAEFDKIVAYFNKAIILARVEGGEMVGFVGAQSIGEPVTQSNLKSFQKAGVGKSVIGGLPRVEEVLSITKKIKTPTMDIVLSEPYRNDKVIASRIASYLKYTTFQDVIEYAEIYYDPNPYGKNSIMTRDGVTNIYEGGKGKSGCQTEIENLPWIIRMVLSKENMVKRDIRMLEMKTSFCQNWAMRNEDSNKIKKEFKKITEKITQCAIITNFDNSPVPIIHIRFDANGYNFNTFERFQEMIVKEYKIKGFDNIVEINKIEEESYVDFDEDGNKVMKKQIVIQTDGINLNDIAQINGIDLAKTRCNHIVSIYTKYGVEAARSAIIREFNEALASSAGFSNYQHVALLADAITHMGDLIPVNRQGANKLDTDPFSRASFEQTVEQLLAAAVFSESDNIRSVSSRVMVGRLVNGGTGCFDLLLDHLKVKQALSNKGTNPKTTTDTTVIKKKNTIAGLIKRKASAK